MQDQGPQTNIFPASPEEANLDYLFQQIGELFSTLYEQHLADSIGPYLPLIQFILIILILALFVGIVWSVLILRDAQRRDREKCAPLDPVEDESERRMDRWEVILNHMRSDQPAEWRLAILEADQFLDSVIEARGYPGEGLGERLKQLTIYDLRSIDDAWEAHKVRNAVAHDGGDYELTQRKTREVIGQFETVLRELNYF